MEKFQSLCTNGRNVQLVQLLWKSLTVPQKIKHRITIWSGKPTSGPLRSICTPMFNTALFKIAKKWKQLVSIDRSWVSKIWEIYIYVCIYICGKILSIKKGRNSAICQSMMNLEQIILDEIIRSQKGKCCLTPLMWSI